MPGLSSVFIFGGNDASETDARDTNSAYTLGTNAWSSLTVLPAVRRSMGSDTIGEYQIVSGGNRGAGRVNSTYKHHRTNDTWSGNTNALVSLEQFPGIGYDSFFYRTGGNVSAGVGDDDFSRLDIKTDVWSVRTDGVDVFRCSALGDVDRGFIWQHAGEDSGSNTVRRNGHFTNVWSTKTAGGHNGGVEHGWGDLTHLYDVKDNAATTYRYSFVSDVHSALSAPTQAGNETANKRLNGNLSGILTGGLTAEDPDLNQIYTNSTNVWSAKTNQPAAYRRSAGASWEPVGRLLYISDPFTVDPFDTLDPVVVNAHAQSGSVHTADDGYDVNGGITAGITTFYVDYNSITETNPDSTKFSVSVDQAGVDDADNDTSTDTTDTTTPDPEGMTLVALDGAERLKVTVSHLDKYANTGTNSSAYYYIKPYTPQAPVVDNWNYLANTVDIEVVGHASEHADVEYSIVVTQGHASDVGKYVQAGGTLGVSAVYQTVAIWGTKTVTITDGSVGIFGAKTQSRNYYSNTLLSVLSPEATVNTGYPPVISGFGAVQQADGGVNLSFIVDDANDSDVKVKLEVKNTATGSYGDFAETAFGPVTKTFGATPDIDNLEAYQLGTNTPITTSSGANTITFRWDAKTDQDGEEANYTIRLTPCDYEGNVGTPVESAVNVDVLDPANVSLTAIEGSYTSGTKDITLQAVWTETHPDTNTYGARTNSTGAWTEVVGTPNTVTPAAALISLPSNWNGDDIINYRCIHVDDYDNTTNTELAISVKPLAPPPPIVTGITKVTADFTIVEHGGDPSGVLNYAIHISGGSTGWIQADGSIDVAAVYQTAAVWGTETIIGLTAGTSYTIYAVAQNPNGTNPISANGSTANFITLVNDSEVQAVVVTPVNDGSKIYNITYQARDEIYVDYTVALQYLDGGIWYNMTGATGDVGAVTYTDGYPNWEAYAVAWDAAVDIDDYDIAACQVKVIITNVGGGSGNANSAPFILDTKLPILPGTISISTILQYSARVTWTNQATETNFSSYEVWMSKISQPAANSRIPDGINTFLWDSVDDVDLALKTTLTTVVTGLELSTTYYVAVYARDLRGNVSVTPLIENFKTLGTSEISGRAIEQNGYPVPNAAVRLYRRDTGALIDSTVSDSAGAFILVGGYPVDDTSFYLVYYKEPWGAAIIDTIIPTPV